MLIRRSSASNAKTAEVINYEHELLLTVLNSLGDAVLHLNTDLVIKMCNGAALSLLNKNELKGAPIGSVMLIKDNAGAEIEVANLIKQSGGHYVSSDLRLSLSNDNSLCIYLNIEPVRVAYGASNDGYVVIMRDITDKKLIDEERDEFINVVGHELKTPVSIAEGSIGNALLIAENNRVGDALIQSLKTAHDQTVFLSGMINDLAVLSRADRGKLAMNLEQFKISELIRELSGAYKQQAESKGLTLGFTQDLENLELSSSRLYVSEILQNLITNAIKYTVSGGVQVHVLAAGGGIQFRITDTGIGISSSDQAKLFEKFFRSNDERVKRQLGTGLGLYITARLAVLLGAKIEARSELGTGSTFTVTFPDLQLPKAHQPDDSRLEPQPLANAG